MITLLLTDEQFYAAQRSAGEVPFCDCGGKVTNGWDSCLRCGRYMRGLFRPASLVTHYDLRAWERFVRERPNERKGVRVFA